MSRPIRPSTRLLIAAVLVSSAGCSTGLPQAPADVVVRYYTPSEIVVPGGSTGRFYTSDVWIYFERAMKPRWRTAVLFSLGTRLSRDRRSIVLPNRKRVALRQKVRVTFESPPYRERDETCGPRPFQVLGVR